VVGVDARGAAESLSYVHVNYRSTFSPGRPVEKDIHARFAFDQDGLITDHVDDFDFRRWASQALGPKGHLVALLPPLRSKARAQALAQLTTFKHEETGSSI
jgi:hypothetical protein